MRKYNKSCIGKGTQVAGLEIINVAPKVEELSKAIHEYQSTEHLTFELAKIRSTDNYGRTHTAYLSAPEAAKAPKDIKAKKTRRKSKNQKLKNRS